MTYYAGIGSRELPKNVYKFFIALGRYYAQQGFILRSGGANGSDSAFEEGCDLVGGAKEIYLPWKDFNNNKSSLYNTPPDADKIAARIHPAWDKLSQGAKKLHSRNICQILGQDMQTPVKFVLCYTQNGVTTGGTATAINLAKEHNIPVFNYGLIHDEP